MANAIKTSGIQALRNGDPVLALRHLSSALQTDPDDAELYGYIGVACGQLNLLDRAVGYLRQAVRLAPESAMLHYNLGLALEDAEARTEAAASFRRALQLDPNHERARRALARMERNAGMPWPPPPSGPSAPRSDHGMSPPSLVLPVPVSVSHHGPHVQPGVSIEPWHPGMSGYGGSRPVQQWKLLVAGLALVLVGAVLGPVTGVTRVAVPALQADTRAVSARESSESKDFHLQRFSGEVQTFFKEIESYYQQTAGAVARVRQRKPGAVPRAKATLSAYITTMDVRRKQLQASLEREQHLDLPHVNRNLLSAVEEYQSAGESLRRYLPGRDEFWWDQAGEDHAKARSELESVQILLGWERSSSTASTLSR